MARALARGLKDPHPLVRNTAAHVSGFLLGINRPTPALDELTVALMGSLEDEQRSTRRLALWALANRTDIQVRDLPAVRRILQDTRSEMPYIQDHPSELLGVAMMFRRSGYNEDADRLLDRLTPLTGHSEGDSFVTALGLDRFAEYGRIREVLEAPARARLGAGYRPGTVSGRVPAGAGSHGVFRVGLSLQESFSGQPFLLVPVTPTGGFYALDGVPPGHFVVVAIDDTDGDGNFDPRIDRALVAQRKVSLKAGQTVSEVDLDWVSRP